MKMRRLKLILLVLLGSFCMLISLGAVSAVVLYQNAQGDDAWPHVTSLKADELGQNSTIYANNKTKIGTIESEQNRQILSPKQMGENIPKALVAIEDRRFYEHDGVDRTGIARAMWVNIKSGGYVQGASTIDQQLVRNIYPEINNDKTLTRKMKEASLAQELNEMWTRQYGKKQAKERIITLYLNLVYFGNQAYGAEAASQTYFSTPAKDLSISQAAMLVGLLQQPTAYDPFKNPEAAKDRRNQVLRALYDTDKISKQEYENAKAKPLEIKRGKTFVAKRNPYFFEFVKKQAVRLYGKDAVQNGGLKIYTTLDPKLQDLATKTLRQTLNQSSDPEGAIVVIENKSGAIRAMATSSVFEKTQFNFAAQAKRQPGSSAKIWTLVTMLQAGIDPDQMQYLSTPLAVIPGDAEAKWEPKTYDGSYAGLINVSEATVLSDNSVFAQMTMDLSAKRIAQTARKMGIISKLDPVVSIGLGSQEVTPLEQTSFYSTIARGGVRIDPFAISLVRSSSGKSQEAKLPARSRVMHPWQAGEVIDILTQNVQQGTGTAAQISSPAAGKTGTTDDYKDAWFCGMTPIYTSCVWVGYPKPRPMTNVRGIRVAGGTFPAEIWGNFMEKALQGKNANWPNFGEKPKLKKYVPGWCNRLDVKVLEGPKDAKCQSLKEDNILPDEKGVLKIPADDT